jgi:hypothetical protein
MPGSQQSTICTQQQQRFEILGSLSTYKQQPKDWLEFSPVEIATEVVFLLL